MLRIKISNVLLFIVVIVGLTEVGVRLSGLTDFPIYDKDSGYGYIPKPSQSGNFLNKNSWAFNDRSMPIERSWNPNQGMNILLIGNSIVMGGNAYPQETKLGPLLQERLGSKFLVWPIGVGGWTTVNESIYMKKNSDLSASATFFVWEYMKGGFSRANPWAGDYAFPTHKPTFASWYVLRRYILPKFINFNMSELPPLRGKANVENIAKFEEQVVRLSKSTGRKIPGLIVIYPVQEDYLESKVKPNWLDERGEIERIAKTHNINVVDISTKPEWNESMYREGFHPTTQGNKVLSDILSNEINIALFQKG